jgi:protein TonB
MSLHLPACAEVFSVREIARAAGVSTGAARSLVGSGHDGYLSANQAVRYVRLLRRGMLSPGDRDLFAPPAGGRRTPGAGIAASGALHVVMLGAMVLLIGLTPAETLPQRHDPARLVFVVKAGPGGGGGGGGLMQPKPPATAEMKGTASVRSPIPPRRPPTARVADTQTKPPEPPRLTPQPPRVEPPPPAPRPPVTPQVVAPVASASSSLHDRAGVLTESPSDTESQGSGSGGGAGTGRGSGIGEGSGAGIGPGSGGGTGGGPYRPGSGITAPDLLLEIKPDYTEDARRMGIKGDVVLEIVVRHDGTVGDVKVLQGLGGGLDRRAVDAVRQWRFSPARRHGTPVDVIVEVAVEFKLR